MKPKLFALLPALALAAACSSTSEPSGPLAAVMTVVFPSRPADTLRVLITDEATIVAAQSFIEHHTGPSLVSGKIVKGAGTDTRYPFHFVPETVRLVDVATELCDGALMRTEAEVAQFFQGSTGNANSPDAQWCPWGSKPLSIVLVSGS
ncbi:MAG TPA: hypothetical protein VIP11_13880 [Gemmatimonadaceae bacterium]